MGRARVELIDPGVEALLNDAGVTADLESRMGRALSAASSSAPVASGAYRDSLRLETLQHGNRSVVRLSSDVSYAMFVEANTGTLARALDAAGGG
jgi:hypothetical protein